MMNSELKMIKEREVENPEKRHDMSWTDNLQVVCDELKSVGFDEKQIVDIIMSASLQRISPWALTSEFPIL